MNDDAHLESLRALAHPARLQILSLLTGAAMSAAEVAREIGTTQANASYHLRRLHQAGEIELVEEVKVRGGTARRFRHVPTDPFATAPPPPAASPHEPERRQFHAVVADELQRRARGRRLVGRGVNVDAELWIDAELWEDAVARVARIAEELHRAARPPRTPGTARTSTTIAMFEMDPRARPAFPDEVEDGS